MTTTTRRRFTGRLATTLATAVGATLAATVFAGSALAQSLSNKPVNLMVPYPAGGLSDAIARIVERPLNKTLGPMVIVENLGGVHTRLPNDLVRHDLSRTTRVEGKLYFVYDSVEFVSIPV